MPAITPSSGPVAVTGASGYVGAMVVQNLLEHGYREVRACVRDITIPGKIEHLLAMNRRGFPGSVKLFSCDLMMEGSYDEVFVGCVAVFHAAAVLERDHEGGRAGSGNVTARQVYNGGVEATMNVLASVAKSGSVRRVIYTSSTAAIMHPAKEGYEFTEEDWASDNQKPENWVVEKQPYAMSKVDAERLAYKFASENGSFDVVSHCPCIVLGPLMCKSHHEIWQYRIGQLVEGKPLEKDCWNITDTRDIAEAQRLSAESASCGNGSRFALVASDMQGILHVNEIQAKLQELYPEYDIAGERDEGRNRRVGICFNTEIRNELGVVPHSVEETLKSTVDSLISLGFIKPRLAVAASKL